MMLLRRGAPTQPRRRFVMRAHTLFFNPRRVATAVVLPGVLAGMITFAGPATAAPSTQAGICNGVVNVLAQRGAVQEGLLRAAAKRNAELITKLQAEKVTMQGEEATLTRQIRS